MNLIFYSHNLDLQWKLTRIFLCIKHGYNILYYITEFYCFFCSILLKVVLTTFFFILHMGKLRLEGGFDMPDSHGVTVQENI